MHSTHRFPRTVLLAVGLAAAVPLAVVAAPHQAPPASISAASIARPVPAPSPAPVREVVAPEPAPIVIEEAPVLPPAAVVAKLEFGTRELTVTLPFDGKVDADTQKALKYFFRDVHTGRQRPMHAGVIAMLADLAAHYPGHTIEVVSGVRSPPNGAPKSKHFVGRAIDLRVRGVKTTEVRDYLWKTNRHVGVGFYSHSDFIHMDHRPEANDCAWSGKREGGKNQYHPRWAVAARK